MILDINAFIGQWPFWPVQARLEGRAAICSTRSVFVHCEDGNREVEAAVLASKGEWIGFAVPTAGSDPESFAKRGFAGLRLYPQHHGYDLRYEPFLDHILEDAAARRWPVLLPLRIIMNWGMPALDLGAMQWIVERHPKVVWILAGINYLWEFQLAAFLMRRFASVHLETSCLMGYAAVAEMVGRCGSGQILFGSGAPLQHAGAGLAKILHARISDAEREAILGGNAMRLIGRD